MRQIVKNIAMVYREFFSYFRPARWQIPIYVAAKVGSPLIESAVPALAVALLTGESFAFYVVAIIGVLILDVIVKNIRSTLENALNIERIGTRLTTFYGKLLKKGITMDYCNVEPAKKQKILDKGTSGIGSNWQGVEMLTRCSLELFCGLFGLLTYGTIMFTIHWSIVLIVAVITGINFVLNRHAVNFQKKLSDVSNQASRINNRLERQGISLEHGKDIRIYHVEHWFRAIFDEQIQTLKRCFSRQELRWYFPTVAEQVGTVIRDLVLYTMLIRLVLNGDITVAQFTFYVGVVAGFSSWMNEVVFRISHVMTANVETGYYNDAMELEDEFRHGEGEKPDLSTAVSVEFRDVSFRYEEDEDDILSHLSFRIEPGQKIALVGNNGAGKTTLVKLLCGFYLPTEGEVLVNGISTRDYDMDEYESLISPVFQDGFMSAFTVAMNIAGGNREDIDRERVRECLKKADIWEKIDSLKAKEDTYISQVLEKEGVEFSGGEVQKLLIARALYKDGHLLILDEPTSALDPIAESKIYEKYNEMTEEKTSIFISHRLASTRFCDEILYLEKGTVAERGTHEELLEKKGSYAEMFEIQSHYYRKEVVQV